MGRTEQMVGDGSVGRRTFGQMARCLPGSLSCWKPTYVGDVVVATPIHYMLYITVSRRLPTF